MATEFISNSWLMPTNANKDKLSNYSLDFDGTSQYIDLGSGLDYFDYTNNGYSVSFWMKTTGTDWYQKILNFGANSKRFMIGIGGGGGKLAWSIYNGASPASGVTQIYNYEPTAGRVNDGIWHHIVLTVPLNVTGTEATIYVDNSTAGSGSSYGIAPVAANSISDSSKPYEGLLTEVAIFDYELSASQVTDIYGTGSAVGNPMSLATKPVAYYPLGDSAFNGEFLATNNATELYENYALDFDGTNDYISVPNSTDFDYGTGDFTWSFWLNVDTHVNYAGLFYFASSGAPYRLKIQSDTTIFLDADTNDVQIADLGTGLAGSGWHSLIFVRNSGTITTYLDGSQVDSVSYSHALNSGGNPLIIANNGGSYLNGKLSNISIYNSALTSGQVTTLYNSGKPFDLNTFAVTPVSWWRLGATGSSFNGSIWTVLDEIGSNNGTGNNLNPPQSALVDGIGASGNGVSSGMSSGTNKTGDSPYSTNNAVSYNMSVTAESTSVPT